jgi:hypothetical protein
MDSTENDNESRLGLHKTQNKANGQRGQQKQRCKKMEKKGHMFPVMWLLDRCVRSRLGDMY